LIVIYNKYNIYSVGYPKYIPFFSIIGLGFGQYTTKMQYKSSLFYVYLVAQLKYGSDSMSYGEIFTHGCHFVIRGTFYPWLSICQLKLA